MKQADKNIAILMMITLFGVIVWTFWRLSASQKELHDFTANETIIPQDNTENTTNDADTPLQERIISPISPIDLHSRIAGAHDDLTLIDTRPHDQYSSQHIPGSYHIDSVDRSLLSRSVVLITENGSEDTVIALYRDLSASHDVLNLDGGIAAWRTHGYALLSHTITQDFVSSAKVQFVEPRDVHALINNEDTPQNEIVIIDTRRSGNYENGHVAHAINIPFADLEFRYREIPKHKKIYVYGANDETSFHAGVLLYDLDFIQVKTIKGGFAAWEQYGYPIQTTQDAAQ